jgi:hypothetical protein
MAIDDGLVYVRRQWNTIETSAVPFDQFHNPYWDDISGQVMQRAPRLFIHGYVWWSDAQDQVAQLHANEAGIHWLKVCVARRDNNRVTFKRLLEIVGPRPKWRMGEHWP